MRIFRLLFLAIVIPLSSIMGPGQDYYLYIPEGFPAPEIPEDNALSPERVELGKNLFFSPLLSIDSSISCASCHIPEFAFSDTIPFSKGVDGRPGTRNAPSLTNVAYHPRMLRDNGVPSLEMQILVPIQEHVEFDFNIPGIAGRLNQDSSWIKKSIKAYGRVPDPFVITRSIAAYERTLISGDSPFDHYLRGNKAALTAEAIRGYQLFTSDKTNCSKCHNGFNFTDNSLRNNGLYESYQDSGRARITGIPEDKGLFKVPTLRNIALTGPYMHDGSVPDLEAVIEHYVSGGKEFPNKSPEIVAMKLTSQDKKDLKAFLESLTDTEFIQRNTKQ